MSNFLDDIAEDCKEAENDLAIGNGDPQFVEWNGGEYDCAPSLIRRGTMIVIGGREVEIKLTLRVRHKGDGWDFAMAVPKSGDLVVLNGVENYRIAQVDRANGAFMQLDLMSPNR